MVAQIAMTMMSSNWCRLQRSILGSSKASKLSMMDALFPPFTTPPHLSFTSPASHATPTLPSITRLPWGKTGHSDHHRAAEVVGLTDSEDDAEPVVEAPGHGGLKGMMKWLVGDRMPTGKELYQKMVDEADRLLESVEIGSTGVAVVETVLKRQKMAADRRRR